MDFIDNKYNKWYNQIIDRARTRKDIVGYTEKHHIVPKSLGGSNSKDNIAILTAREHFICHWLLTKMVLNQQDRWKMVNALGYMMWATNENQHRYKISGRVYDLIKTRHSQEKSLAQTGRKNSFYGKQHTSETKKKMSKSRQGIAPWNKGKVYVGGGMTGKKHTADTKQKIREKKSGTTLTDDHKKKIAESMLAKKIKRSEETKIKMSQAKKGVKHSTRTCEHCKKSISVAMYARWHGAKCSSTQKD